MMVRQVLLCPSSDEFHCMIVQVEGMLLNIVVYHEDLVGIAQMTDPWCGKGERGVFAEVERLEKRLIDRTNEGFVVDLPFFQGIVVGSLPDHGEIVSKSFDRGRTLRRCAVR